MKPSPVTDQTLTNISVIIPAHNAASFLQQAVDSVLSQTRPAREIIIVNDGSKDGTLEIARGNEGSHPSGTQILVIDQKNAGVSAARNAGAARASGEYLAFMDADDLYLPGLLAAAEKAFRLIPSCVCFFSNQAMFDDQGDRHHGWLDGKPFRKIPVTEQDGILIPQESLFLSLLAGSFIPPSASVIRRDIAMTVGLFDPGVTTSEDRDFYCRLALFGPMAYVTDCLSRGRLHESNVSFTTASLALSYNSLRVVQKFYHSRWDIYMSAAERQEAENILQAARRDYRYFASQAGLARYLDAMRDAAIGFPLDRHIWRDLARALFGRG